MHLSGTTDVTPIIGVLPRASKRASVAVQFLTFEVQKLLSHIGNKSSILAPQKPYTHTEALICAPNGKCWRACHPLRISSRPTYVLLSLSASRVTTRSFVHATQGFHPRGLIGSYHPPPLPLGYPPAPHSTFPGMAFRSLHLLSGGAPPHRCQFIVTPLQRSRAGSLFFPPAVLGPPVGSKRTHPPYRQEVHPR